jgi:lipopolysaccharide transport system ATP-binding protein
MIGATLHYPIGPFVHGSIKANLFRLFGIRDRTVPRRQWIEALTDVSLTFREGDRVGIIGRNGAGKSTLLRAIAGIYPLSSGTVQVTGKIQSIFELGVGFETDATGRENILFRALVTGSDPALVRSREEEIVRFADLGEFIDLPIRTYSAGMLVRLAFAISSYLDGDVLLIDEVFGAGDAEFQSKALARLRSLIEQAKIVLLVGHNLKTINRFCERVLWIDRGRIVLDGDRDEVTQAYLAAVKRGTPAS